MVEAMSSDLKRLSLFTCISGVCMKKNQKAIDEINQIYTHALVEKA